MAVLNRFAWVFGLAGATAVLAALGLWFVLGDLDGAPRWFALGGSVSLAAWLFLDRDAVGTTVTSRGFAYGGSATLMTVMAGTIAGGLFIVARDHDTTWDWTGQGAFTLSDHTNNVCARMADDVTILAFFRKGSFPQQEFLDLSRAYAEACPRLTFEHVDPVARPSLAREHEVNAETGVLVLTSGAGLTRRVEGLIDEDRLTEALVVLLADKEHRICWTMGHGEPSPDDEQSERGLGRMVFELDDLNYQVIPLITATEGVPRACDAVVVASPEVDWLPFEREALAAYLAEGGKAFVLLEPEWAPDLAADLGRYGLELRQDIVLDLNPKNQLHRVDEPTMVLLTDDNLRPHPITASLGASVVLGVARSVSVDVNADGVMGREILVTSDQAWGETDLGGDVVEPDPDELQGEVPLMAVVEISDPAALEVVLPEAPTSQDEPPDAPDVAAGAAPALELDRNVGRAVPADFSPRPGGRLVVIGDADFANNVLSQLGNNRDLFLNSIAWLVDEVDQIGERPDASETLELSDMEGALLILVTTFVAPGLAIVAAVLVLLWRRRR